MEIVRECAVCGVAYDKGRDFLIVFCTVSLSYMDGVALSSFVCQLHLFSCIWFIMDFIRLDYHNP